MRAATWLGLTDTPPAVLQRMLSVARRVCAHRRGVVVPELHWALCHAFPQDARGMGETYELIRKHCINLPSRLVSGAWLRWPLFKQTGPRGVFRLLTRAERFRFHELADRGDPRIFQPHYLAEPVLGHPRLSPPRRKPPYRPPSSARLADLAAQLSQPFSLEELFRLYCATYNRVLTEWAFTSFSWMVKRHTINDPVRLAFPGKSDAWLRNPLYFRDDTGCYGLLSEPERKAFLRMAESRDSRLMRASYPAREILS